MWKPLDWPQKEAKNAKIVFSFAFFASFSGHGFI